MTRLRQTVVALSASGIMGMGIMGCAGDPKAAPISPNAEMETQGDQTLTWNAPSAGKLTVYDNTSGKIVYGSPVKKDEAVKVDVDNNRVTLDTQTVEESTLHRGDQYRIYFEPTTVVERTATVETNSVETVHDR
jgi:hypothetical protein